MDGALLIVDSGGRVVEHETKGFGFGSLALLRHNQEASVVLVSFFSFLFLFFLEFVLSCLTCIHFLFRQLYSLHSQVTYVDHAASPSLAQSEAELVLDWSLSQRQLPSLLTTKLSQPVDALELHEFVFEGISLKVRAY
jgi:hypothetical protein